jgi:uncharacterized protein (DUF2236 family)
MPRPYFVDKHSVVRKIWGTGDNILLIFAGAAAEFALNKAVDWLYFTGRLPSDPLGRLFSTVEYARTIVFSENETALNAIRSMRAIHDQVEKKRGANIPDWAYRDVLFMLIDYSIRSFETLERKLTYEEKMEVFHVFNRVGNHMGLYGLPDTYEEWVSMREQHLASHLHPSHYTKDLFRQYRLHLGFFRYKILIEAQTLVVPDTVRKLLDLRSLSWLTLLLPIYKLSRRLQWDNYLKEILLPSDYQQRIKQLDRV